MSKESNIIGYCPVDSGQILLIDPCYVWDGDSEEYEEACHITLGEGAGEVKLGVVTKTAYGDGLYPVKATYDEHDRIVSITIDFVPSGSDYYPRGYEEVD